MIAIICMVVAVANAVIGYVLRQTQENSDLWLTHCWIGLIFAVLAVAAAIADRN